MSASIPSSRRIPVRSAERGGSLRRVRRMAGAGGVWAALSGAVGGAATLDAPPVAVRAQEALLAELRRSHPAVTEWRVQPLTAGGAGPVGDALPKVRSLSVRSRVDVGGRSLWFAVEGLGPVSVTRRELRPGDLVDAQDLEPQIRPVFGVRCAAPLGPQAVEGGPWEVAASRRAGSTLCAGDLRAPSAVARGASVAVAVRRGGVAIEMRGIAQGRGGLGDSVSVRLGDGDRMVRGRVVASGRVVLDE